MLRTQHAEEITQRFREMVEQSGDILSPNHYDELSLLIEAGIDTALVDYIERMAEKLEALAADVRKGAEFFD